MANKKKKIGKKRQRSSKKNDCQLPTVENPNTGNCIKIGGDTYNQLVAQRKIIPVFQPKARRVVSRTTSVPKRRKGKFSSTSSLSPDTIAMQRRLRRLDRFSSSPKVKPPSLPPKKKKPPSLPPKKYFLKVPGGRKIAGLRGNELTQRADKNTSQILFLKNKLIAAALDRNRVDKDSLKWFQLDDKLKTIQENIDLLEDDQRNIRDLSRERTKLDKEQLQDEKRLRKIRLRREKATEKKNRKAEKALKKEEEKIRKNRMKQELKQHKKEYDAEIKRINKEEKIRRKELKRAEKRELKRRKEFEKREEVAKKILKEKELNALQRRRRTSSIRDQRRREYERQKFFKTKQDRERERISSSWKIQRDRANRIKQIQANQFALLADPLLSNKKVDRYIPPPPLPPKNKYKNVFMPRQPGRLNFAPPPPRLTARQRITQQIGQNRYQNRISSGSVGSTGSADSIDKFLKQLQREEAEEAYKRTSIPKQRMFVQPPPPPPPGFQQRQWQGQRQRKSFLNQLPDFTIDLISTVEGFPRTPPINQFIGELRKLVRTQSKNPQVFANEFADLIRRQPQSNQNIFEGMRISQEQDFAKWLLDLLIGPSQQQIQRPPSLTNYRMFPNQVQQQMNQRFNSKKSKKGRNQSVRF